MAHTTEGAPQGIPLPKEVGDRNFDPAALPQTVVMLVGEWWLQPADHQQECIRKDVHLLCALRAYCTPHLPPRQTAECSGHAHCTTPPLPLVQAQENDGQTVMPWLQVAMDKRLDEHHITANRSGLQPEAEWAQTTLHSMTQPLFPTTTGSETCHFAFLITKTVVGKNNGQTQSPF